MARSTDQVRESAVPIEVQVTADPNPHLAEYAERRVREVFRYAHGPVLHARVRVARHADPALDRPVIAQANLDVDGRWVRAQIAAASAQEAVDLLHDRLRHRLQHVQQRVAGQWEDRRGRRPSDQPHEWRHDSEPTHRPPWFPRPPGERRIIRHKSFSLARCDVDEAAADMEALGFDFHLFTESGSEQDSVLYRAGPTGYRLAQVNPNPEALAPHVLEVTVSGQPAPLLSTLEAVDRMALWDRPFLFFLDGERGRGAVLYHRYDGHYGLINPAE